MDFFFFSVYETKAVLSLGAGVSCWSFPRGNQGIVGRFLTEKVPAQPVIQQYRCHGHRNPQQGERQADLAQQIAGKGGIIPDIPPQSEVHNTSGEKLQGSDDTGGSDRPLPEQRRLTGGGLVQKTY